MASIFDGTPISFSSNISARPGKIVAGDIDNDGDLDIATYSTSSTASDYGYSVGINDGNGQFTFTSYTTSFQVRDLELFDLGNNSTLDIILLGKDRVETSSGTILVPTGAFTDASDFSISTLGAGDTGPGDTTIRIVDRGGTLFAYANSSPGSLSFSQTANVGSGAQSPESIATGFINNDQTTDSVIANYGSISDRYDLDLFLGSPPTTSTDLRVGEHPRHVDLTDIDRDGDLDITSVNYGSQSTSVILNNGDGTFSSKTDYSTQGRFPVSVIYMDADNDGNLDQIVATRWGDGLSIRHGLGDGTFGSFTSRAASSVNYMVAADFDGDNRDDLLWTLNGGGISGNLFPGLPPVFISASTSTDGTKVILTYDEALSASTAATSNFAVTVAGSTATISSVATSGSTVELTLASAINSGEGVTVAYTDPTGGDDTNATQDSAGNDAASLSSTAVTNNSTVDSVAPVFVSAATSSDGIKVILTYNEALNSTTAATTDFVVSIDGSAATISSVTVSGSTVELTLATAISIGQTVTIAYNDPTANDDANAVQDAAGNDAASLAGTAVTNNSTVSSSSGGGGGGGGDDTGSEATPNLVADNTPIDPAPAATNIQSTDYDNDGLREVVIASDGNFVDGNRDGIPDAEQSQIAGLRMINNGALASDYGSISIGNGLQLAAVSLTSAGSENTLPVTTRGGGTLAVTTPDGISNAFAGVVSFNVSGVAPGGKSTATITFPTGLAVNRDLAYLRFNYNSNRFEDYVDALGYPLYSFVDQNGDGSPDAVVLQLVDGDPQWDGDGIANGTVVDPGFLGIGQRSFTGTKRSDSLIGNVLANEIRGKAGKDRLYGDRGADFITAGKHADLIIYYAADESSADQPDTVKFGKKDRFHFRSFDGDSLTEGRQSPRYIGNKAFTSTAGELRFARGRLLADTTGDGQADFAVNFAKAIPWFSESNLIF